MSSERDPTAGRAVPDAVTKAQELSNAAGFEGSCTNAVGWLLATLAASANGHILELGTGHGVGTAWLLHGARHDSTITTVETDRDRAGMVAELFAGEERVDVVHGTFDDIKNRAPFSLVFLDVANLKDDGSPLIPLLAPGAVVVLDDFTPEWLKGDEWRNQKDNRREFWRNHPELVTTEVLVTASSAALIAVKR